MVSVIQRRGIPAVRSWNGCEARSTARIAPRWNVHIKSYARYTRYGGGHLAEVVPEQVVVCNGLPPNRAASQETD